jgi:hypothetical protein
MYINNSPADGGDAALLSRDRPDQAPIFAFPELGPVHPILLKSITQFK